MLCYVMLCYVMLCYVMLCCIVLCYVMLCYGMLCYVMLFYVMCYESYQLVIRISRESIVYSNLTSLYIYTYRSNNHAMLY
jgi:hypothetical protein